MHPLHDYIARQIGKKLEERGVVVWYDPRSEFVTFVDELAAERDPHAMISVKVRDKEVALAEYGGSFFELRHLVEPRVASDAPRPTLLYLPGVDRDRKGSVLMELEQAGTSWEPQFKHLARYPLLERFTEGVVDQVLESKSANYTDVAAMLKLDDKPSALKAIFSGSKHQEVFFDWLVDPRYDAAIVAKDATEELVQLVRARIGLSLEVGDSSIAKLRATTIRYVLGNEFRSDLGCPPPSSLETVPQPKTALELERIRTLAARLRRDTRAEYAQLAEQVEKELLLREEDIDPAQLGSIDTFPFEERALLRYCQSLVEAQRFEDALRVVAERETSFWIAEHVERKQHWELCRYLAELGLVAREVSQALATAPEKAAEWVERYTALEGGWHRLDLAQRRLEAWVVGVDDVPEQPLAIVRRLYEDACHRMAQGFTKALVKAKWAIPEVEHQTGIFAAHVGGKSYPIAYFLVDAMRYEMAVDAMERMPQAWEVALRPAIGSLPSITPIGMAALQPGAASSFDVDVEKDRLGSRVDGNFLPDLVARRKHATARIPKLVDLTLDELLGLTPSKLKSKVGGAEVVLVRSQEIDHAGETGFSFQARSVMETVLDNVGRAIRRLAALGIEHAVVTADHGHLFFPDDRDESMRTDAPGGAKVELHRRCWIGRGGTTPTGCVRVQAAELGYASDLEFVFPVGAGVFKAGGDLAFHHGGPSLQELIVPVLWVKAKSGQSSRPKIALSAKGVPYAITNRIFSVEFSLSGNLSLFEGAALVVKPVLLHKGRQVGAAVMTTTPADFDRATATVTLRDHPVTVAFLLNDADHDIVSIRIVVQDPSSDAELYRSDEIPLKLGV